MVRGNFLIIGGATHITQRVWKFPTRSSAFYYFYFFLFKKRFNSPKIIIKNFCEKAKSPLKAIFILFLRMLWSFHYFILFILFIYFLCLVKYQMPLV
jgi:hypothetical protein